MTYGFDRIVPEYFAYVWKPTPEGREEVLEGSQFGGCSRNTFFERMERFGFGSTMPEHHRDAVALDLPF